MTIRGRTIVATALAGTTWLAARGAAQTLTVLTSSDASVDELVAATAATAVLLVLAWVWVALLAHAAAMLPGVLGNVAETIAVAITPAACRGAVRVALGLATVASPLSTACASAAEPIASSTAPAHRDFADLPQIERPAMIARWVPSVPAPAPPPATPRSDVRLVTTAPSEAESVPDEVVIRRGDTLWDIAARVLGPQATAAEIATEWPKWYVANRDVIGPDPDVIHPGTVLRAPAR